MNDKAIVRTTDADKTLVRMLNDAAGELRKIAPGYVKIDRLLQLAIEAKMRNPLLEQCSPVSVLNFCKRCAEWGTDRVGAGGAWAVPFWNSKTKCYDMVPIPDWRLLIEKAKKAKAISHATAEAVYENDEFSFERGLTPSLVHRPALSNRGKIRAVYCVYILPDGTKDFVVMDWVADVLPIRDRTNAWKSWIEQKRSNPWVTDEVEQGKKTVVKRTMKLFEGASIELTALLETDNAVLGFPELAEVREPIAMPREIEATVESAATVQEQQQSIETKPAPAAPKPAESAGPTVTGIVAVVSEKNGTGPKGAWTAYSIKIDGSWYSTFDSKMADIARQSNALNRPVVIEYEKAGKYTNVKHIDFAEDIVPGE